MIKICSVKICCRRHYCVISILWQLENVWRTKICFWLVRLSFSSPAISPLKWQILEITAIFWREQQINLWFINFGLAESIECMYRLNQVSVFESKTLDVGLSNTSHIKSTVDLHHVLSSFCAALSHTSLPSVWYKRFIRTTPDYNCFALHHLIGVIAPQVITVIVFLRVRYAKQKGGNEKKNNRCGVRSVVRVFGCFSSWSLQEFTRWYLHRQSPPSKWKTTSPLFLSSKKKRGQFVL